MISAELSVRYSQWAESSGKFPYVLNKNLRLNLAAFDVDLVGQNFFLLCEAINFYIDIKNNVYIKHN